MAEKNIDKSKALEGALAQLNRSFGVGAVMKMGERPNQKIDAISTGSLGLDIGLGISGLPRGRIVEIYGPESSGKCLTEDTMVLSDVGLISIKELFEHYGHKTSSTTKVLEQSAGLLNENSEIEQTSHFTWNGKRKIRKITTALGNELSPTHNHPIRVMNETGFIIWKKAKDIKVGDMLPVMRGTNIYGNNNMDIHTAQLMGYLVADGSLGRSSKNSTRFSNSDSCVIEDFYKLVDKELKSVNLKDSKIKAYPKSNSKTIDHHINSKEFREYLVSKGLDFVLSKNKQIPLQIRQGSKEIQLAFLRAYLECECSIDVSKRSLEVISASYLLLQQIQLMLLNMGFVGILSTKTVSGYGDYARLTYSGSEGSDLIHAIGFKSLDRLKTVNEIAFESNGSTNIDGIPHLGVIVQTLYNALDVRSREAFDIVYDYMGETPRARITYDRLQKILNMFQGQKHILLTHLKEIQDSNFFYTPVIKIEEDEAPTFDVCLPKTHSFWSNGLISHNTTLTLQVAAEAQKLGGTVAFIDAEHALDPGYAKKLGVDVDNILISQPDNGEQALEIADTLVRSGAVDVVIVDSVAALTPRSELEGEMGDSHVGLQARLMSQGLRKLTGSIARTNTLVFFTNQLRSKIGVMFGCFHYDARVRLADGTSEKIGKIVNQKMDIEVLSYNEKTGEIEPKKILNYFNNGKAEFFLHITTDGGPSGLQHMPVTENHMIFMGNGIQRPASVIEVGDKILSIRKEFDFTKIQKEFLIGTSLGDGSIRRTSKYTSKFRFGHGKDQKDYIEWKHRIMGNAALDITEGKKSFNFDVIPSLYATKLHNVLYNDQERSITEEYLKDFNELSLAVWYLDDGTYSGSYSQWGNGKSYIYNKKLSTECREIICAKLKQMGLHATFNKKAIIFNSENTKILHEKIYKFVPKSMNYKLHPNFRNTDDNISNDLYDGRSYENSFKNITYETEVVDVSVKPKTKGMEKFDIEIEDNHNYIVDGMVVHNSPETTAGGNALKFYASVRMDIRRIGSIKIKDDVVGNQTRVKIVKNKVAPPFRQVEFDIIYGEGVSKRGELIDIGVKLGIVEKSGAWYSYDSQRIGQGRENVKEFLKEHPEMAEEIEQKIRSAVVENHEVFLASDESADYEE